MIEIHSTSLNNITYLPKRYQNYAAEIVSHSVPEGVEVKPGEEYTFVIHDFKIPAKENFYVEFRMLQEGYQYFGETGTVNITVK